MFTKIITLKCNPEPKKKRKQPDIHFTFATALIKKASHSRV